ncbi:MAG: hypothetical protein Q9225_003568 [Loekoesia sp. 1 TL-2023]
MVYREFLRPKGRDGKVDPEKHDGFEQRIIDNEEYAIAVKDSKHRANLFATSKQVNAEASEVWYDTHFFKATISSHMRIDGESERWGSVMPMPTYLPKIRNLGIYVDTKFMKVHRRGYLITRNFTRLCYELAAHCHKLRNMIIEISCICHMSEHRMQTLVHQLSRPLTDNEKKCLSAENSERLLMPLGRIRVSQNIQLKSSCKSLAENVEPIFDRLTAKIRSSDPIDKLERDEAIWWKLKERAQPFLKDNANLGRDLHTLHEAADIYWSMKLYPGWRDEQGWQHAFNTDVRRIEKRIDSLQASANGGL